jgi:CHAT domain-containing protein/tetratricopeptide (TPR) repeat protein
VKVAHVLKKSTCRSGYFLLFFSLLIFGVTSRVSATIDTDASSLSAARETFNAKTPSPKLPETPDQLHNLALQHKARGEYGTAVNLLKRALASDEKVYGPEDPRVAARSTNLAMLYHDMGRYDEAESLYEQALAINEKVYGPDHPETAGSLANLAKLYYDRGQYRKADSLLQRALAIYEQKNGPDHPSVATVLNSLAMIAQDLGNYGEAQSLYTRGLAIDEAAYGPNHPAVARDVSNLAQLYYERGDYGQAEELYERALAMDETAFGSQHTNVAIDINNLAGVHFARGQYARAKLLYERALAIDETAYGPRHPTVANDLNNLARLYCALGNYERAQSLYEQALLIFEESCGPFNPRTAIVLNNLAQLHALLNNNEKSESFYEQALLIYKKVYGEKHPRVATVLNNLAGLHYVSGAYHRAQPLYQEALSIDEMFYGSNHPRVAIRQNNLAELYVVMGEYDRAQNLYQQALTIAETSGQPELLWRIQFNLGYLLAMQKNPSAAIFFGKQAVNTIQGMREGIVEVEKDLQASFLDSKWYVYRFLAGLLIDFGRLPEAQQILQMQKEEEYFDFLCRDSGNRDVRTTKAGYTDEELKWTEKYKEMGNRLTSLGKELGELKDKKRTQGLSDGESKRYRKLSDEIATARMAFASHLENLTNDLSRISGKEDIGPGNEEDLRQALTKLGHGAVLVHYLINDDKVRIILTTCNQQLAYDVGISSAKLNQKIMSFRKTLQNPRRPHLEEAQALYKIFIAPIDPDLKKVKAETLLLSLDGTLRYLPVAALHDGKCYLVERYQLAIYTAAAGFNFRKGPTGGWEVGGLGLSRAVRNLEPLPFVPEELEGIVRRNKSDEDGVLPGVIYLDEAFSQETFKSVLKEHFPVVHIASHFELNPGTQNDSYLVLGDGTALTLRQIRDDKFDFNDVEVLALSACNTGVASSGPSGSEVESFGTLAQDQGAQGVLATLWPVADHSTGVLMQSFYKLHAEHPDLTKAEALRQAQLDFIRGKWVAQNGAIRTRGMKVSQVEESTGGIPHNAKNLYTHPFYWAPFILMGNWL